MVKLNKRDNIVLLLDGYGRESKQLHTSLKLQGKDCVAVAMDEDGFLPEDVTSPYGFFLGDFSQSENCPGKPLYFDRLQVPRLWEIKGTNSGGQVYDKAKERGRIFYAKPENKRLIRIVDWVDESGVVRSSDHYNQYGALFARTTFSSKGHKFMKSYFSAEKKEIITENFVTGNIILNLGEEVHIFRDKVEFICFFLKTAGLDQCRFYYNSLSTPSFVSERMTGRRKEDVLFWQEPRRDDIPGNMQIIFAGNSQTGTIVVQKKHAYDRLLELGAPKEVLRCKGFVYPFHRENGHGRQALICTNSDQIAELKTVVKGIPDMKFHIAALTEMSSKLMEFGRYSNVELYPNVKDQVLQELFTRCDYYLDINYANEIVSAVYRAFLQNMWILAFRETCHSLDYVAEEHIYALEKVQDMIAEVKLAMEDDMVLDKHLKLQKKAALAEIVEL